MLFLRQKGSGRFLNEYWETSIRNIPRKCPVFNWGITDEINAPIVINPPEIIKLVSNKPLVRKMLDDNGIRVPLTFYTKESAVNFLNEYPKRILIGRPTNHHSGEYFTVIKSEKDFARTDRYWSLFIPKRSEYRVFLFFDRVMAVAVKQIENREEFAWNHSKGSTFVNIIEEHLPEKLIEYALRVNKVLKAHFIAVDIIRDEDHYYYVLEGNTCPRIESDSRIDAFNNSIIWLDNYIKTNKKLPELGE